MISKLRRQHMELHKIYQQFGTKESH